MTDELEKAKANMARAIMRRAVATADADESEEWFAEQFTTAALDAVRETHHLIPLATVDDGELVKRSAEVRSELWAALIGNDQSHKDLIDRIEALTAENERLREKCTDLASLYASATECYLEAQGKLQTLEPAMKRIAKGVHNGPRCTAIARAALGDTQ